MVCVCNTVSDYGLKEHTLSSASLIFWQLHALCASHKQKDFRRKVLLLHWPHSPEQSPVWHSLHEFYSFIQTGSEYTSFQELLRVQLNPGTALFTISSSCIVHSFITCNSVIHYPLPSYLLSVIVKRFEPPSLGKRALNKSSWLLLLLL